MRCWWLQSSLPIPGISVPSALELPNIFGEEVVDPDWIGLRENLQERPISSPYFTGKIDGFRFQFSQQKQSMDGIPVIDPQMEIDPS